MFSSSCHNSYFLLFSNPPNSRRINSTPKIAQISTNNFACPTLKHIATLRGLRQLPYNQETPASLILPGVQILQNGLWQP
jgi:hypothetical protein